MADFADDRGLEPEKPVDGLPSILADLESDLNAHLTKDRSDKHETFIAVPSKPNWVFRYSTKLSWNNFMLLTSMAKDGATGDTDQLVFAMTFLSRQCRGLEFNGKDATDNGKPLTFASEALQRMTNTESPQECLTMLFGGDGGEAALIATSNALLIECGYGAEVRPTKR